MYSGKTLGDYIRDNVRDVVDELCQYQNCDNCSIGWLYEEHGKECILHKVSSDIAIDLPIDYTRKDIKAYE